MEHRLEAYALKHEYSVLYRQGEPCFHRKTDNASSHAKHFYREEKHDVSYREQGVKEK